MYQFETRARHMYPKAIPRTSTNGEVEVDGEENDEKGTASRRIYRWRIAINAFISATR